MGAFKLDSPLLSREEAESICATLRRTPWPSYEEADRTSVYTRVWGLLEKHQRPDIYMRLVVLTYTKESSTRYKNNRIQKEM